MIRITTLALLAMLPSVSGLIAADEPTPNVLTDSVDPFVPGKERIRFLTASGVDTELDEAEAKTDAKRKDAFVRVFDKWSNMLIFDKNGNKRLDWFEADAYRRALKAAVIKTYDKNKSLKLDTDERVAANKDLATGKVPRLSLKSKSSPAATDNRPSITTRREGASDGDSARSSDRRERFAQIRERLAKMRKEREARTLKEFDKDGNGKLSESERNAAREAQRERFRQGISRLREGFIKEFDKDGDGKLSEEERKAMGEQFRQGAERLRQAFMKEFDKDGDGKISDEERKVIGERLREGAAKLREDFMKQVDKDGDGKISESEREAAIEYIRKRFSGEPRKEK